jgi:hypothetical protein
MRGLRTSLNFSLHKNAGKEAIFKPNLKIFQIRREIWAKCLLPSTPNLTFSHTLASHTIFELSNDVFKIIFRSYKIFKISSSIFLQKEITKYLATRWRSPLNSWHMQQLVACAI